MLDLSTLIGPKLLFLYFWERKVGQKKGKLKLWQQKPGIIHGINWKWSEYNIQNFMIKKINTLRWAKFNEKVCKTLEDEYFFQSF